MTVTSKALAASCLPAVFIYVLVSTTVADVLTQEVMVPGSSLTQEQAVSLAKLALSGLDREFPNKPANVLAGPESIVAPQKNFPAFYGCFDWHSSVHGHWMLVRILRLHPNNGLALEIRNRLNVHLSKKNLEREAAFFADDTNKSFERMYGWAWLLRLATELHTWTDEDGKRWRENLRPLEKVLVNRIDAYLPLLTYPIRTGEHPDTGFALGQLLDYSRAVGNVALTDLIIKKSREYYLNDDRYPTRYEPSGQDFFSTGWNEADLMRRVLSTTEFDAWFSRFLPELSQGECGNMLTPAIVTDVTDGKLVHLVGLNLSRAWCQSAIARSLPKDDPRIEILDKAAQAHLEAGLKYVFSGHYAGEHWLATFAIYALTQHQ